MNHTSRVATQPIQGSPTRDPYAQLALHIIRRAAWDYKHHPGYQKSVGQFFASDWYKCLLDYITVCIPDFDPDEYILPDGIVIQ